MRRPKQKTYKKDTKPFILEAFIQCINDYHKQTRQEVRDSGVTPRNPHFFEQGEFVSFDGFDKYGNIIYRVTQPGTTPDFDHHIIAISYPYVWYQPYHDRWTLPTERNNKIESLLNDIQ